MSNLIDRAVGYFNPRRGLQRHYLRQALQRAYEGASKTDGWKPRRAGASANTDHAMDAAELRARSRALVQNVPYVAQGLRVLVAQTVGGGIEPTWSGVHGDRLNTLWNRWVGECDADGRQNYYGLQASAYRAMVQDGEVLLRLRWRRESDGLAVPLQLQLLEIDWLDSTKTGAGGQRGHTVTNGIERDALGRLVGYWLYDQHPGDQRTSLRSLMRAGGTSHFVPASDIIHLHSVERPGQGRGFPRAAPIIARVRDLQVYEDAEQARKNLESRLSVLASGDLSQFDNALGGEAPKSTTELGSLAGGQLIQLPPGMTTTVVEPKAAPGYVDYLKWQLHLIAAGFGVPYESMTGDMREVNFSSARVRLIDFRREVEMEQWTHLVPNLCAPVCHAFERAAVLARSVPEGPFVLDHATPKWDYVNPAQDVRADLDEISGGLSSISEKLRRRGYKPDQVFAELATDIEKLKDLGLFDALAVMRSKSVSQITAAEKVQDD